MNEKFKYAPGKPGYGTKGDRGEDGQQGLAMYFTSLNPNTQATIINNKIANNLTLWPADEPLPDGRVYVTGDLFFDSDGLAYEINAETDTYQYKFASLNMGGFFVPLGKDTSNGFERYFNSNSSPKFIIDNVYTLSGAIDYTAVPEDIYDVQPKNFTRIEFTNIKSDPALKYNAFTVYTSGENAPQDNHKALAIVYNEVEKAFHIGNLDNTGLLRNTNLIFDVSLLRQKKELGKNTFTQDTCMGAVLTNYEMTANSIFDPNFDAAPSSFYGTSGITDCSVNWILSHFVNGATDVYGDLYFFENNSPYNGKTFSFINDVSLRPLIFSNVPTNGHVTITGCSSTKTYSYYMKLYTDTGWVRNSEIQNLFKGIINVTPTSLINEPSAAHFLSDSLGFNVESNATWDVSFLGAPSWIIDVSTYYDPITFDGSIRFGFTENTGTARSTTMQVRVFGGAYQNVSVSQKGGVENVTINISQISYNPTPITCGEYVDASYGVTLNGLPADTVVNVQFVERVTGYKSGGANGLIYNAPMTFKKNLTSYSTYLNGYINGGDSEDVSTYTTVPSVVSTDVLRVNMPGSNLYAQESMDVPCENDWFVHVYFYIYVTYISGTPINVLNNGTSWGFTIPST